MLGTRRVLLLFIVKRRTIDRSSSSGAVLE
jgi:hypothetical protein